MNQNPGHAPEHYVDMVNRWVGPPGPRQCMSPKAAATAQREQIRLFLDQVWADAWTEAFQDGVKYGLSIAPGRFVFAVPDGMSLPAALHDTSIRPVTEANTPA